MIRKFLIFYIVLHVQFSYANEFEKGMFALEMEDYDRAVYYLSFEASCFQSFENSIFECLPSVAISFLKEVISNL